MLWQSKEKGLKRKREEDTSTEMPGRGSHPGEWYRGGEIMGAITTVVEKDNIICEIVWN